MKLLLSSKGLINEELTENFISFSGSKRVVTIVTTASQEFKESNRNTIKLRSKLNELGFRSNFIDIEFDDPKILKRSEIIVIAGGNPYYLLHQLQRSRSETLLKEIILSGTPLWGISAGFMILMRDLKIIDLLTPEMNSIGLKDKKGLRLIEEIVIPHYDRFIKEGKIQKRVLDEFELQSNCRIIRLGEYQCINYVGDKFEIIGELTS